MHRLYYSIMTMPTLFQEAEPVIDFVLHISASNQYVTMIVKQPNGRASVGAGAALMNRFELRCPRSIARAC
jgi:hypothetical protein